MDLEFYQDKVNELISIIRQNKANPSICDECCGVDYNNETTSNILCFDCHLKLPDKKILCESCLIKHPLYGICGCF